MELAVEVSANMLPRSRKRMTMVLESEKSTDRAVDYMPDEYLCCKE